MSGRIAFQGELGAYSHQACAQARPDFTPVPCQTFEDVVEMTRSGAVDLGMLAVENSTYGRVADVHSLLPKSTAPERVISTTSSKVWQGTGVKSGRAWAQAWCE